MRNETTAIARGSLTDVAARGNVTVAECFVDLDAIVIVDTSASMGIADVRTDDRAYTRYRAACDELERLQRDLPGRIGVVSFASTAEFCPAGFPRLIGTATDMVKALEFVKVADGCGIKLILISDGQPNDCDGTLRIAQTFTAHIDTIFIGGRDDDGADFLRRLAAATGGRSQTKSAGEILELGIAVKNLLTA